MAFSLTDKVFLAYILLKDLSKKLHTVIQHRSLLVVGAADLRCKRYFILKKVEKMYDRSFEIMGSTRFEKMVQSVTCHYH